MNRRHFITGSSALALSSVLPSRQAEAFVPCLLQVLRLSAAGRHIARFGSAAVRFAGRSGSRARYIGRRGAESKRRKYAREILVKSRNTRFFKEVGELVLDNMGNGFPEILNGNITACSGGYRNEVYCGTFPSLTGNGKPVIMEIAELQLLDKVAEFLPNIYRNDFYSSDTAESDREILSFLHPVEHIKDSVFGNEWNHIKPLVYKTARGIVTMEMVEGKGKCVIEPADSRNAYVIPVRWNRWNVLTGERA